MTTQWVTYEKPETLISFDMIEIDAVRSALAQQIHNPRNSRSTAAFMDSSLCYFEPGLLYQVAVQLCHASGMLVHWGDDPEFTARRQRVIASIVAFLKDAGAVQEELLRSESYYCAKFKACISRGYKDPTYMTLWLLPVKPAFFWGADYPGVGSILDVIQRRRRTGLANLRWVAPMVQRGEAE